MSKDALQVRALKAREVCRERGITQQEIALALGASQPQVSRILKGVPVKRSRLLEEVLLYVERFEAGVTAQAVRDNDVLIEALKNTWDGSAQHAQALSAVIRSLAVLGRPGTPSLAALKDRSC